MASIHKTDWKLRGICPLHSIDIKTGMWNSGDPMNNGVMGCRMMMSWIWSGSTSHAQIIFGLRNRLRKGSVVVATEGVEGCLLLSGLTYLLVFLFPSDQMVESWSRWAELRSEPTGADRQTIITLHIALTLPKAQACPRDLPSVFSDTSINR